MTSAAVVCTAPKVDAFARIFSVLKRARWVVVLIWLVLAGVAVWPALQFVGNTSQKFAPPPRTEAFQAAAAFAEHFPMASRQLVTAVLLTCKDGTVLGDLASNLTVALRDDLVPAATAAARAPAGAVNGTVLGFYSLAESYPTIADGFVSPDGKATVVLIPTSEFTAVEVWAGALASGVERWVSEHRAEFAGAEDIVVEVTGMPSLLHDSVVGVEHDLLAMDSIALPLALLVLACVLRSLPLMVVPLICVAVSFSLSFGILDLIAVHVVPIAAFCPPICLSIVIAMTFDYTAFIGSRWQEELDKRRQREGCRDDAKPQLFRRPVPATEDDNSECVSLALLHAGRNVATSGLVLFACLLALVFMPMRFISTIGLAAAITLGFTILTSLTLTPALLLCLRRFVSAEGIIPFLNFSALVPRRRRRRRRSQYQQLVINDGGSEDSDGDGPFGTFWKWLGKALTSVPVAFFATVVVVVITLVLAFFAQRIQTTKDVTLMSPWRSPSLVALRHMFATSFPPGVAEPYKLLVLPKPSAAVGTTGSAIWTAEFFESTYDCVHELCTTVGGLDEANVVGLPLALGTQIPWDFASKLTDPKSGWFSTDIGAAYRMLARFVVSTKNSNASFVLMPTSFNPMENVTVFVHAMREGAARCSARSDYTFLLVGDLVSMQDAVAGVERLFPLIVGVTFTIVAVLLFVAFRSAVLPLRTLLTVVVTLGATFGAGTMVFVLGWFNGLSDMLASSNLFFWFTPLCAFVVILGLSIDYDLFMFTRVFENRAAGMSTKQAIAHAVHKTGGIITAAGLIMALSFGGLLLSSIMTIVQIGFMLCFSVLFDTFIVRTLLVPGVLRLLAEANWWPHRFSDEHKHLLATF